MSEVDRSRPVLVVLAGSDAEPAQLPTGADKHPLSGPKGLAIRLAGVPLIDHLLARLKEVDAFGSIFIAGPATAYGESRDGVEVIDTDGSFGENIEAAIAHVESHCPGQPLAVTTCDILPDVQELRRLLADYKTHEPLDFWFPMILAPPQRERLGASAWKPQYRVAPSRGTAPVAVLPGHLVIVNPEALRKGFIFRSFDLAYRSRNRPIAYRSYFIVTRLLLYLLGKDLRQIMNLRVPAVTLAVIFQAIIIASKLRRGVMTPVELAQRFRMVYVRSRHRRLHPNLRGRLPLVEALSLAKDMDTQEEAQELVAEFASSQRDEDSGGLQ